MKKRLLSLTLAAVMGMSLLAGCGGTTNQTNNQTETKESEPAKVETESTAVKETEETKETENIVVYYYGVENQADQDMVIDAMNKYSEEKIGVTITFKPIATAEYADTVTRVLATKEEADLVWTNNSRVTAWSAVDGLMEISDLLKNYPDLTSVMPEKIWDSVKFDGKDYIVPNYKEAGSSVTLLTPVAMADAVKTKYGIDFNEIECNSLWDIKNYEEYILACMELGAEVAIPYSSTIKDFMANGGTQYERLTDPYVVDRKTGTVYNFYDVPEMKDHMALMNDWLAEGIWQEKQLMSDYNGKDYLNSGSYAINLYVTVPNNELSAENTYKVDVYTKQINEPVLTSISALGSGWSITKYSEKAEACMEWLQLINTDAAFAEMWVYGIEGTHYTKDANGIVSKTESKGWANIAWRSTNTWIIPLANTEPADKKEQYTAFNESAVPSQLLGFRADFSKVSAELAAAGADFKADNNMMSYGFVTPEELDTKCADLKKAGDDKIKAEIQAQVDAFLGK